MSASLLAGVVDAVNNAEARGALGFCGMSIESATSAWVRVEQHTCARCDVSWRDVAGARTYCWSCGFAQGGEP